MLFSLATSKSELLALDPQLALDPRHAKKLSIHRIRPPFIGASHIILMFAECFKS